MLSDRGAGGLVPWRRPFTPQKVTMRYGLPPEQPPVTTIRVRMVKTTKATLDGGRTAKVYEAGQDYELPEWLAEAFFKGGEGDPSEAHEGLDGGPEQTHSEAATAATEAENEAAGRVGGSNEALGKDRAMGRPGGTRRLRGQR